MKNSLLLFILFSTSLWASESSIQSSLQEIRSHLEERLISQSNLTQEIDKFNLSQERVLANMISAYDYLKRYAVTERYIFMYEGMNALLSYTRTPDNVLDNWLKKENSRILNKNLHPAFVAGWKKEMGQLQESISNLSPLKISSHEDTQQSLRMLDSLDQELITFINEAQKEPVIEAIPEAIVQSDSTHPYYNKATLLALAVLSFLMGFSMRRKKTVKVIKAAPKTELPPPFYHFDNDTDFIKGTSLEEACKNFIDKNPTLFKRAGIDIYPSKKSVFKSEVQVSNELIEEALESLFKGALAVSNLRRSDGAYLEWTCTENSGRVGLEITLHGIACDEKSIYLNTLVDEENSAPALFSKSEIILEEYYPSISLLSQSDKTVINLGIESKGYSINH